MKNKLPEKCIACFNGHECGDRGIDELTKKEIEQLDIILSNVDIGFWLYPSECNAASSFDDLKKYVPHIPFFKKYNNKIHALIKYQEETFNFEDFIIDIHGDTIELFWNWEHYNGLYNTSGSMKALYHHESEDETWSKSETRGLIEDFDLDYESIECFEDFLKVLDIKKLDYEE